MDCVYAVHLDFFKRKMISKDNEKTERFFVGIDIGSTTVKIVAGIPKTGQNVYSDYRRMEFQVQKKVLKRQSKL